MRTFAIIVAIVIGTLVYFELSSVSNREFHVSGYEQLNQLDE